MGGVRVGVITGSGTYALGELEAPARREIATRFGACPVTEGVLRGAEIVHVARHGPGHARLSNHVSHRANVLALREAGAEAVLAVTVCGAVDPTVALGSLVVFDDLHFPSNRLPDGALCTLHTQPGAADRAHWVFDAPFSQRLREAFIDAAAATGVAARDGGCYGHVDGPRFNTRSEIRALAACGVTAVSQTAGPEAVLCGEAGLPYALLGYATDHANGVSRHPTSVDELLELIGAGTQVFAAVLGRAVPRIGALDALAPTGAQLGF